MEKIHQKNGFIRSAIVLAAGLCIAAFFYGGVYETRVVDLSTPTNKEFVVVRTNRFTGYMRVTTGRRLLTLPERRALFRVTGSFDLKLSYSRDFQPDGADSKHKLFDEHVA